MDQEIDLMRDAGTSDRVERRTSGAARRPAAWIAALLCFLWVGPAEALPQLIYQPSAQVGGEAQPPLPEVGTFPVQLVLDDDGAEGAFGVGAPTALQFMWLNQFDRSGFDALTLEEVWVLFPDGPQIVAGGAVEIAVYLDPDGDPSNGAELLTSFEATIQVADGDTFSIYPLPQPLIIGGSGDVLIGVVNRYVSSGVTPETRPAALDVTASQGRSWVGVWSTDPPADLALPADLIFEPIDGTVPGNWMIRGFGSDAPIVVVPTLNTLGLIALSVLLALGGWVVSRRRARENR